MTTYRSGNSRMRGNSSMFGNSSMYGNSRMRGNSSMYGNSSMHGNSSMFGNSALSHEAKIRASHIVRDQWLFAPIMTVNRSDGYTFAYWPNNDGEWIITAGCRAFNMKDAEKHWRETRAGTPLGEETFLILETLKKWRVTPGQKLWDERPEKPEIDREATT